MSETETNPPSAAEKEAEKQPEKKPARKTHKARHAKKSHSLMINSIILLMVLAAAAVAWWQYNEKQQRDNLNQFNALTEQLDKLQRGQRYQSDDQQAQLDELAEQQQDLKRSFGALLKNSGHLRNDWLLAEAEYLVKLANHRLILEKDITTAITALTAADDRLKEVSDPALLEVRKILLEQTQSLRTIEQPDITGIALQISALKNELPKLPMQTPDPATVQQRKQQPSNASRVESLGELPAAMWQDIKNLLIIRDHSQAVQPLIPPEQRYFLLQNINLQLEQARLAVLKGNNSLYADSLATATRWIENHFDTQYSSTKVFVASLNDLTKINIEPAIPDISQSFKVLRQFRLKGFITPEKTSTTSKATKDKAVKSKTVTKVTEATNKPETTTTKQPGPETKP